MTVCGNCGTRQGPFERLVLPLTHGNDRTPAKNQRVIVTCGFRPRHKATPDERKKRAQECNARRAALEGKTNA